jgi:FLVCR family feline leukemia virus subgroup C receptor-related protein
MAQITSDSEEPLREPLNHTLEEPSLLSETSHSEPYCKIYKRRWSILFTYVCFAFVNNVQWIQYAIINNLVIRYYNVGAVAVDWTSIIFMATYAPLIFPALYFLEKKVSIVLIEGTNCRSLRFNDTNLISSHFKRE